MVLEDYGELMFLQTVLKKIGFDVDAIQNPRQFNDSLLTMNPDVLVMTSHGKRVRGLEMARTVKKNRSMPHIVLIRNSNQPAEPEENVNLWLESPVGAISLLNALADLCGLNKEVLADKFTKLRLPDVGSPEARVLDLDEQASTHEEMQRGNEASGNFEPLSTSTVTAEQRKERYQKFLKTDVPKQAGFSVKEVQQQVRDLRQNENPDDLAELERERKAFVEHLFKKKD